MSASHRIRHVEIPGGYYDQAVHLENDGTLTVDDYTYGKSPLETFGDADLELGVTVEPKHVPALARALGLDGWTGNPEQSARLVALVAEAIGDDDPLNAFERWCDEHGIPCERWDWA